MSSEIQKKEFMIDYWPEVYSSRQNHTVLSWPAVGVEKHNGTLCLIVSKDGVKRVKGIIPLEETGVFSEDERIARARLTSLIGQDINFIVISTDKKQNLFVASRAKAMEKLSSLSWDKIAPGQVRTAIARRIVRRQKPGGHLADLGIVLEIEGIEAFLPAGELSHGWVEEIESIIQPGDRFDVYISEVDKDKHKLLVSIKTLYENPWPSCIERYIKNGIYRGIVTGVVDHGIFVNLEPGVDSLCHHPRSGKLKKGDGVAIVVTRIVADEKKINGVIARVIRRS